MTTTHFTTHFKYMIVGFFMLTVVAPVCALAQHHQTPSDQKSKMNALIKVVRESTERFKDVAVAEAEGYHLMFGCVSGPDAGAMGMHFVNMNLVGDGELDATRPEIVLYE